MNNELLEALTLLEKEKNISKDTLLEAIEQSLIQACKNNFGKADNVKVSINPETCEFHVWAEKTVVEEVTDDVTEIALSKAKMIRSSYELGDTVNVEIHSKEFGRIATQNAKNVILQKIREEERKVLYNEYYAKERDVVTGIVQRYLGKNVSVNLGKVRRIRHWLNSAKPMTPAAGYMDGEGRRARGRLTHSPLLAPASSPANGPPASGRRPDRG